MPTTKIVRNSLTWHVGGFDELEPKEGKTYFPVLFNGAQQTPPGRRIISIAIPCYNEDAENLRRTIESLKCQILPPQFQLEVLVAMDGTEQMSASMKVYIEELFGISTTSNGKGWGIFDQFPSSSAIIVEPLDFSRFSNVNIDNEVTTNKVTTNENINLSLVIKRTNRRKVNSQMWWLRCHAKEVGCEFAFATDCGIMFDKRCLGLMLQRLDDDPALSGLTGYQRVMTADMQGDGPSEMITDPLGWFLRTLQSYDFELSQSTTKSALDTIGFLSVLPGPCSLFRYDHLKDILDDYFTLTTKPIENNISGIVLGNIQLAGKHQN